MSIEKRFPESSNDIMYKILNFLRRRRRALLKEGDRRILDSKVFHGENLVRGFLEAN